MRRRDLLACAATAGLGLVAVKTALAADPKRHMKFEVEHTPAEWRKRLSPAAFEVLREEGTERPGSSPLTDEHRRGTFACMGCELSLFDSKTKFDSGTGWPSFYAPIPKAVIQRTDLSLGVPRQEVLCRRCGGHLGHVFDDGPRPTGLRYCMNGVALDFHAA